MLYKIIVISALTIFIFTLNVNAKEPGKSIKKQKAEKKHYFTFIDTYAKMEEKKKKEEIFKYENQDRFQFKFQSSLSEGSNIVNPGGGHSSGTGAVMGSGVASGAGGQGTGGGRHGAGGRH